MCTCYGIAKGKHMTSTVCQAEMGVAEVEEEEDFEIVVGRLHCEETR